MRSVCFILSCIVAIAKGMFCRVGRRERTRKPPAPVPTVTTIDGATIRG